MEPYNVNNLTPYLNPLYHYLHPHHKSTTILTLLITLTNILFLTTICSTLFPLPNLLTSYHKMLQEYTQLPALVELNIIKSLCLIVSFTSKHYDLSPHLNNEILFSMLLAIIKRTDLLSRSNKWMKIPHMQCNKH